MLDVYGHLYEGVDEAAMEGLDRLRSEAQTDSRASRGGGATIRSVGNPCAIRVSGGGRYWDRTSDLCRVKAALSR